jgi:hypothetical protein
MLLYFEPGNVVVFLCVAMLLYFEPGNVVVF